MASIHSGPFFFLFSFLTEEQEKDGLKKHMTFFLIYQSLFSMRSQ